MTNTVMVPKTNCIYTLPLKERYRIGKKQNREDHRFTSNLHGLMMMIVENTFEIFLLEISYLVRNK